MDRIRSFQPELPKKSTRSRRSVSSTSPSGQHGPPSAGRSKIKALTALIIIPIQHQPVPYISMSRIHNPPILPTPITSTAGKIISTAPHAIAAALPVAIVQGAQLCSAARIRRCATAASSELPLARSLAVGVEGAHAPVQVA
jgi:hypothetical protein